MNPTKGKRPCPAAGREITPAECGDARNSRLACPVECPFNPFSPANYERILELEDKLDLATLDWMRLHSTDAAAFARDLHRFESSFDVVAGHSFVVFRTFHRRDADGLTEAERWERAGFPGLNNDQRVLFRAKSGTHACLFEVHRVIDDCQVEAVDLLDPAAGTVLLVDRSLANRAVRFTTLLGWGYRLPHIGRISGALSCVEGIGPFSAAEAVMEIVRHLGGPTTRPELDRWFAENMAPVCEAIRATAAVRHRDMMQGSDLREAKALYELRRPYGECLHRLESHPAVDEAELTDGERSEGFADAREWFETLPSDVEPSLLLGRIVLGQSHWRLECIGGKRIAEFRRQFESLMGPLVRFSGERLDDTIPSVDPLSEKTVALVPPRLLENPDRIEITASRIAPGDTDPDESLAMEEKRLRLAFIDRPATALDGKSAREASRDPALRPRLVELLKNQIRTLDLENRRRGTGHDLDDILRELGLGELIFPPPPLPAGDFSDDGDDDGESSGSGAHAERREADTDRPAAPPLPAEPLTFAESQKRLNRAMEAFRTPDKAEDDMDASGTAVLDDLNDVIGDLLDDDEFEQLVPIVISVWYGLVAPGSAAPEIDADRLADVFDREYDAMDQTLDGPTPRLIEDLALRSPQPDYGRMCAVYFAAAMDGFPRKRRPLPDAQLVMLAALFAVIERLDAALRPKRI